MLPFAKKALSNLFKKPDTVLYPKVESPAKPAYRGRIVYDAEKCVNCGMCIKVCSPGAITRTVEEAEGGENITYTIDLTSCTFCATCQDFCGTKAISLSEDYHMVAENAADLRVTGTRFKKAVEGRLTLHPDDCVYCGLCARTCPENAITVDRSAKSWSVNYDECVTCGQCIDKCPKKALAFEAPPEEGVRKGDACVYCSLCMKRCPVGAITVDRAAKTWAIDRSVCIKCGLCVSSCPKKTLSMGPLTEEGSAAGPAEAAKQAAEAPSGQAFPAAVKAEKAEASSAATEEEGVVLSGDCVYCGLCARNCPVSAIRVDRASKSWEIDRSTCIKCGLCISSCPKKALTMGSAEAASAPEEKQVPASAAAEAVTLKGKASAVSTESAADTAQQPAVKKKRKQLPPVEPILMKSSADNSWEDGVVLGPDCIYCGMCARKCPMQAIVVDRSVKSWQINRERCVQCSYCVEACPKKTLSIRELKN